jgi:hypothetical protein
MKKVAIGFSVVLIAVFSSSVFANKPLTHEERVKAQEAIERVYYSHRIWPKENPQPKPPFEKMVAKEQIEAKVNDYLKKCSALDQFWQRPIIASQLQAEMDRMAKGTKDATTLNELFAALNNDPYLIAECLARPVLADRLIHNWYANDSRFHVETKAKAEEALKTLTTENFCESIEGQYSKMKYKLEINHETEELDTEDHAIKLPENEFARMIAEIPEAEKISQVIEKDGCLVIMHTIFKNAVEIEIESLTFPKRSIENWLNSQNLPTMIPEKRDEIRSFVLPPVPESACTEGWDNGILEDGPTVCSNYSMVWTGSELILWGTGNVGNKGTGLRFNPDTGVWLPTSTGANCPYYARNGHTSIWTGTEVIICGGGNLSGGARYNPSSDTWEAFGPPSARSYHTAIWTGTKMIVWGGIYEMGINYYLNTGDIYDPSNDTWTWITTGTNVPEGRARHSAVWTGTEMIVWGGSSESMLVGNSGGRFNPSSNTWLPTSTGTNCPSRRSGHTAVWTGSEMIVWGGGFSGYYNDGGRYNPSSDTWTATSTGANCPTARSEHAAFWTSSGMIIWGGGYVSGGYVYLNSGGLYDPSSDTWTATSTGGNCPPVVTGYRYHSVWTGSEMIVWQCSSTSGGGRYDPLTDSWIRITGPYIPSRGDHYCGVWTGAEMIIWAATTNYALPAPGARYSPSTDSWNSVSTGTNCPSGRSGHSAVWTGSEMIVWGGYTNIYSNTGGRYNPSGDTWTATSGGTNCPSGRRYHTAVWTGSEMIIWGGSSGSSLNSGGKYDPNSDSWSTTSTETNCPSARSGHTAVWTGMEMVVWGAAASNTGGRYYPSTNSWLTTSTGTNCPTAASRPAIWTGTEMVVWGGYDANLFGTGGRYNPSTDSWTPMSNGAYALFGRDGHTAVWTGSEMIVWGGILGSSWINSGGRYNPSLDSWIATPEGSGVPSGRASHVGVWTGNGMIIWGGTDGYGYPSSGGQYFIPYSPSGLSNNSAADADACGDSGVSVGWTDPTYWGTGGSGAGTFDVLRNGTPIATGLSGTTHSYVDTTGDNGVSYLYQVRASNLCSLSVTTTGVSAVDNAGTTPSGLANNTAADTGGCADNGVTVYWTAPSGWNDNGFGARTFDVLRDGTPIATGLSSSTVSYMDTTGANGVSYNYQVKANNGCGLSAYTAGALATDTVGAAPDEVVSIGICSWNPSAGAEGYRVYRGTKADLPNLKTSTADGCLRYEGAATSFDCSGDDPGSVTGKLYWYLITAYIGPCECTSGAGTGYERNLSSSGSCP